MTNTLILRAALAVILLSHSVPSIVTGDVYIFGEHFLNQIGFAPMGVPIAWSVKLSHIVCAVLFLVNRYVSVAALITIVVLFMGIVLVHYPEGWYVVGNGRNGVEYNFFIICVLVFLVFPQGIKGDALLRRMRGRK